LQRRELKKFIALKIDNRSERIGVIHDDAVTNVNRKTKPKQKQRRVPKGSRLNFQHLLCRPARLNPWIGHRFRRFSQKKKLRLGASLLILMFIWASYRFGA
jgi:hypothetical protein